MRRASTRRPLLTAALGALTAQLVLVAAAAAGTGGGNFPLAVQLLQR